MSSSVAAVKYRQVPESSDGLYHCHICKYAVKRKDNFKRHMIKIHGIKYEDKNVRANPKNKCVVSGCKDVFYHKSAMVRHLDEFHHFQSNVENKTFSTMQEFLDWKEFEESCCFVYFTKRDEKSNNNANISNSSYVCYFHRSSQANTQLKTQSVHFKFLRKTDTVCSARMLVKRNLMTDQVKVKYIKTHSHSIFYEDQLYHPLPTTLRNEIEQKLKDGLTVQDVYSCLCQKATLESISDINKTRLHHVNIDISKIEYMQQKLLLPRSIESSTSFEDRFRLLELNDGSHPTLIHSVDINDFIGFQSAEQLSTFQKYASKIVFVECMNPVPNIPFYTLTLKVFDENWYGLNVARLVMHTYNEQAVKLFFQALMSRCMPDKEPTIQNLVIDYSEHSIKPFYEVFGRSLNIIISKYHIHKLMFTKFVSDYPGHSELLHNVYYSLVKIIEATDKTEFQKLADSFVLTYKDLCGMYVDYIQLYLACPENWALSYRESVFHKCDSTLHLDSTFLKLKAFRKGLSKEICSWNELINHLLNFDQVSYLKHKQLELSGILLFDHHKAGMAIPSEDVIKVQAGQWLVFFENSMFEVNLKADVCPNKFCLVRCLEVECCNLCQHWYSCSCQGAPFTICMHIHKVHATALLPE